MKALFCLLLFAVVFSLPLPTQASRPTNESAERLIAARRRTITTQTGVTAIREVLFSRTRPSVDDLLYINVHREIAIINLQALGDEIESELDSRRSINEVLKKIYGIVHDDRFDLSSLGLSGSRWAILAVNIALLKVEAEANRLSHLNLELNDWIAEIRMQALEILEVSQEPARAVIKDLIRAIDAIPSVNINENSIVAQQERQFDAIRAVPNWRQRWSRFCEFKAMGE